MRNEKLTDHERAERDRQIAIARMMIERRRLRAINCSRQAMQAKQHLIAAGKGKNGRSMLPALLARHAAA